MTYNQSITAGILVAVAVGLAIYDLYVYFAWGSDATISWTLALAARQHPWLGFAAGLLLGHIFVVPWFRSAWALRNYVTIAWTAAGVVVGAVLLTQVPDRIKKEKKDGPGSA